MLSDLLAGALQDEEEEAPIAPNEDVLSSFVRSGALSKDVLIGALSQDISPPPSRQSELERGDSRGMERDVEEEDAGHRSEGCAWPPERARAASPIPRSLQAPILDHDSLELLRGCARLHSNSRPRPPPLSMQLETLGIEFETVPPDRAPGPPTPAPGCGSPQPPPLPPAGLEPEMDVAMGEAAEARLPSSSCQREWWMATASTALGSGAPSRSELSSAVDPSSRSVLQASGSIMSKDFRSVRTPPTLSTPNGQPLDMRLAAMLGARAETAGSSTGHSTGRSSTGRSQSRGKTAGGAPQQPRSRTGSLLAAAGGRMLPDRSQSRSSPMLTRCGSTCSVGIGPPAKPATWHTAGNHGVAASLQSLPCTSAWRGRPAVSAVGAPAAQSPFLAARCPR